MLSKAKMWVLLEEEISKQVESSGGKSSHGENAFGSQGTEALALSESLRNLPIKV